MSEIASFDVGRYVECDMCGTVLTDDPRTGGFIFSGKGVGPCCAGRVMASVEQYGEQAYIQGRCTPGVAFADWIRTVRGQTPNGNRVVITGLANDYDRGVPQGWERRYAPGDQSAHLIRLADENATHRPAACGKPAPDGGWRGTGGLSELLTAGLRPLCAGCEYQVSGQTSISVPPSASP